MCLAIFEKADLNLNQCIAMWYNTSLIRGECMVDDDCSLETACIQVESFNHSNISIDHQLPYILKVKNLAESAF